MFYDLHGSQWVTTIDLVEGYDQIPIKKEDIHKTAINIMGQKYEFSRMPFGRRHAPFSFQRTMVEALHGTGCVKIYLDDLLIDSK